MSTENPTSKKTGKYGQEYGGNQGDHPSGKDDDNDRKSSPTTPKSGKRIFDNLFLTDFSWVFGLHLVYFLKY